MAGGERLEVLADERVCVYVVSSDADRPDKADSPIRSTIALRMLLAFLPVNSHSPSPSTTSTRTARCCRPLHKFASPFFSTTASHSATKRLASTAAVSEFLAEGTYGTLSESALADDAARIAECAGRSERSDEWRPGAEMSRIVWRVHSVRSAIGAGKGVCVDGRKTARACEGCMGESVASDAVLRMRWDVSLLSW